MPDRSGIIVRATKRLATRANITVKASCLKSWPAIPTTNIIGKNTTTVVSVEAIMALADGDIARDEFVTKHVALQVVTPGKEAEFFDLLSRATAEFE